MGVGGGGGTTTNTKPKGVRTAADARGVVSNIIASVVATARDDDDDDDDGRMELSGRQAEGVLGCIFVFVRV